MSWRTRTHGSPRQVGKPYKVRGGQVKSATRTRHYTPTIDPYERYKERRMDSSKKKVERIVMRKEWKTVVDASPYRKYFIIYVDPDTLLPVGWIPSGGGVITPLVVKDKKVEGETVKEPLIPLMIDRDEKYTADELEIRLDQRVDDWWTFERDENLSMVFMVSALPLSVLDSIAKLGGATDHLPSSHK